MVLIEFASGIEMNFDERKAEELSNICKTNHFEIVLKAGDMEILKRLNYILDEPRIVKVIQIYIANLASKFVKVALRVLEEMSYLDIPGDIIMVEIKT